MNALTVVLCGSESLRRKFGLSILEALASCITITVSLDSLPPEETASFIETRLQACGASIPLFTKNALKLLHLVSGGIMRSAGTIANAALLQAFLAHTPQVEAEQVQAVVQR